MKKTLSWLFVLMLVIFMTVSFSLAGCKNATPTGTTATETTAAATTAAVETTAAAETTAETTPGKGIDELIVGIDQDMSTNDLQIENAVAGLTILQMVYNGLVELDKLGNIIPSLAESWDISSDGKEYTFHLRKGVKFHNGRELTSDDVKFSIDRVTNQKLASMWASNYTAIKEIQVIDNYTIKFKLDAPNAPFLYSFASGQFPIVAKESYDPNDIVKVLQPIGTGPFKFADWVSGDYISLESFNDYWAGAPTVKKIKFQIIPDENVRLTALKTGDVDVIYNPPAKDAASEIKNPSSSDWKLAAIDGSVKNSYIIAFNVTKKPFDNVKVREAIAHAINSEDILNVVSFGIGEVATSIWPKANPWYANVNRPDFNIEKSKQLLEEAGYPNGFDVDLLSIPSFSIDKMAEVVQSQLGKVGIKCNVRNLEIGEYSAEYAKLNFDMAVSADVFYLDPNMWYGYSLTTGGSGNWFVGNYHTKELDELLKEAVTTTNIEERKKIYTQVAQSVWSDVGFYWTHLYPVIYGYRTDLKGADLNVRGDAIYSNNKGLGFVTR